MTYISGMKNIDKSVYEAAKLDGAANMRLLISICLPLLAPMIVYQVIMTFVGGLQAFDNVMGLATICGGNGTANMGSANSLATLVFYLYTINCRAPYLQDVFQYFGPPNTPIEKGHNGKTTYLVGRAIITDETLCWLSSVPNHGIRITEPIEAVNAIKEYYDDMGKKLTSKKLFQYKMNRA